MRGKRVVLRRRLRLLTVCVGVVRSPRELYECADNEAILAVLTHKVGRGVHAVSGRLRAD